MMMMILLLLVIVQPSWGFHEETHYPCAFIDTANISGSYNSEGSYIHNWTVIPRHLVAAYDFVIENGIRIPAPVHLRACICKTRPCVRICCPEGETYDLVARQCLVPIKGLPSLPSQKHMEVELNNGSLRNIELKSRFSIHLGTPCEHMKAATKGAEYVHWTLHEVGFFPASG